MRLGIMTCTQAIDLFFSIKVYSLTEYRLTDLNWKLLNALYVVLNVSSYQIQIHLLFAYLLHRFLIYFSKSCQPN